MYHPLDQYTDNTIGSLAGPPAPLPAYDVFVGAVSMILLANVMCGCANPLTHALRALPLPKERVLARLGPGMHAAFSPWEKVRMRGIAVPSPRGRGKQTPRELRLNLSYNSPTISSIPRDGVSLLPGPTRYGKCGYKPARVPALQLAFSWSRSRPSQSVAGRCGRIGQT